MTFHENPLWVLSITFHAIVIPTFVCCLVLISEKEDTDQRLLLTSLRTVIWAAKIIIGIGLFIEIFFMVYQCNLCVQLFHKWRNCNRIICLQNAPKIGGTVQQLQQQAVASSASSQLPTNELTSEDTDWFSLKESKFYNCQSDSNSNTQSNSSYRVKICVEKSTSAGITKTITCSTETSLIYDCNHLPLSEVVISTAACDNSRNDNRKVIADKIQTTENDSRETSLIATTENALVPVANDKCPLSEFMASSTAIEPVKGKFKKIICHFFPGSRSKEHAEDEDFLLA